MIISVLHKGTCLGLNTSLLLAVLSDSRDGTKPRQKHHVHALWQVCQDSSSTEALTSIDHLFLFAEPFGCLLQCFRFLTNQRTT